MSGIVWPAVTIGQDAARLGLTYQLERSQWWPSEALCLMQMQQLARVVRHAYRTVPFYRYRLRPLADLAPGALTPERLRSVPVLTRLELQSAGDELVSARIPPEHGSVRDVRTSGSTGRPIRVKSTEVGDLFGAAINLRNRLWHGTNLRGTVAAIQVLKHAHENAAAAGAPMSWGPLAAPGAVYFFDIRRPLAEQLAWLVKVEPDYLMTYPTNLLALATRSHADGVVLRKLQHVMTMGEVLTDEQRSACRDAWGVDVIDTYSAAEVRTIALQCPAHRHYLVQAESLYVEILDRRGEPCRPGETGRVVISDLHNFATPLIRYDLGDYAEVGGPCPTGRGLPVLERIVGRTRSMLTYPSGEVVWPSLPGSLFTAIAPVQQFQLVQTRCDHIEVRLVLAAPLTERQEGDLRDALRKKLGYPFEFAFLRLSDIPRSAGGKYEDFRSEITDPV